MKGLDYDIQLDDMRVEESTTTRDNITAIERSIRLLQQIIDDINTRLEALE